MRKKRKIDIFLDGVYVCSTIQCSTLKEACIKFYESHPTNIRTISASFDLDWKEK